MTSRARIRPISTWKRRIWPLAALAAAATLLLTAPAQASFPGANGKIAFARGTMGEIYSIKTDGSSETNLTSNPAADIAPSWSPDGSQIVFATTRGGTGDFDIFKMNADGSGQTLVSGTPDLDWAPTWSPDGSQIAFSGNYKDIYVVNADGTNLTNVTNSSDSEDAPAWSPDGFRIAFQARHAADPTPNYDVWTMNPDGSGQVNLTNNASGGDYNPDWSPDGSKIAFESNRDGNGEVYVMDADGSNQTRLTNNSSFDGEPTWSPDGRKILFTSDRDGNRELYVMNPDGSGQTRITNNSVDDGFPSWQPLSVNGPPPYDAPQSASLLNVALVPDFRQTISASQCAARGGALSSHGSPLALVSCNPPAIAPGYRARMGPSAVGHVQLTEIPGNPATAADEADLGIGVSISDVRALDLLSDYDPNASGPDMTMVARWRLTDSFNGASASDPGTVSDTDYPVPISCTATADPTVGSDCTLASSANAVLPGTVKEGKHMVIEVFRARLNDAGADGVVGNADDRRIAMQGIYIP
jgi:hypothetical protein